MAQDPVPPPAAGAARRGTAWTHASVLGLFALAALALAAGDERAVFAWFNRPGLMPPAGWQALSVLGLGASALILFTAATLRRRPQVAAAVWLSLLTTGLPIHVLKRLVERPRPAAVLPPELIEVLGRPLTHGALPSGHSGTAMAALAIVLLARPALGRAPWTQAGVAVLALLVMWSRMACGAHWPWDVLAGASLGWLGGALAVWWAQRSGFARWCASPRAQPWLDALLLVISVASAFDDTGYPDGRALQIGLALLGSAVALWRLAHKLLRRGTRG
jgi:undecaprenyl-diphosphatase